MKLLVLRSDPVPRAEADASNYEARFESRYADRVIGNLFGEGDFCTACGPACSSCRNAYNRHFRENVVGIVSFPGVLPYVLDHPEQYVPGGQPRHDVLLAVNIHEQVLLEILKRCRAWGTRGIVVPIEAREWVSGAARAEAQRICAREGIELAFPKPFCSFRPPQGSLLAEFREFFHIGAPDVAFSIKEGRIVSAEVRVSAPCGATYFIAKGLLGHSLDDDLRQVMSMRLHSYPCTASMAWDAEIGDTVLHVGAQAQFEILKGIAPEEAAEEGTVMSPLGRTVQRPLPVEENVQNVERAKAAILWELERGCALSLSELKAREGLSPAAVHAALLILRRSGRIEVEGSRILPASAE